MLTLSNSDFNASVPITERWLEVHSVRMLQQAGLAGGRQACQGHEVTMNFHPEGLIQQPAP